MSQKFPKILSPEEILGLVPKGTRLDYVHVESDGIAICFWPPTRDRDAQIRQWKGYVAIHRYRELITKFGLYDKLTFTTSGSTIAFATTRERANDLFRWADSQFGKVLIFDHNLIETEGLPQAFDHEAWEGRDVVEFA